MRNNLLFTLLLLTFFTQLVTAQTGKMAWVGRTGATRFPTGADGKKLNVGNSNGMKLQDN